MQNRVIIYSFSQLAINIAQTLQNKNYHILIVEENKQLCQDAKNAGYDVSSLSLMEDENIIKVGLQNDNVEAFFCLGDDKNINLFITLSVRNLNKDIKIISTSSIKGDNEALLLAGANKIINPYEIGALRIFRLLNKPFMLDLLDSILFSKSDIEIAEITIQKDSTLDGVYLDDLKLIQKENIIILGIQDKEISDKFIFLSTGINHKIDHGDVLVLLGYLDDLKKFEESISI